MGSEKLNNDTIKIGDVEINPYLSSADEVPPNKKDEKLILDAACKPLKEPPIAKVNDHQLEHIHSDFERKKSFRATQHEEFQVEALLDEAADLIERCISTRTIYEQLREKQTNLFIALTEEHARLKLHRERRNAGSYDVDKNRLLRSKMRTELQYKLANADFVEAKRLHYLIYNDKISKQTYNSHIWRAWASTLPGNVFEGQNFLNHRGIEYDGFTYTLPALLLRFAGESFKSTWIPPQSSSTMQWWKLDSETRLFNWEKTSWDWEIEWEKDNIKSKAKSYLINFNKYQKRVEAYNEPNGSLNYRKYMDAFVSAYRQDLNEAISRIEIINDFLYRFYDFNDDPPLELDNIDIAGDLRLWIRQAIQQIKWQSRNEISTTIILPVNIDSSKGKTIASSLDDKLENVRLRGISAFLPEDPKGKHVYVSARVNFSGEVDRDVLLSRVSSRSVMRNPIIFGVNRLMNIDPNGTWNVTITDVLNASDSLNVTPKTLFLELHIVAKMK